MQITDKHDEQPISEEEIDKNLDDSFPASDPPSWTLGTDHRVITTPDSPRAKGEASQEAPQDLAKTVPGAGSS